MKCDCGEPAILNARYASKAYCEECFTAMFEKRFRKSLKGVIKNGDKIAVAVSGGKDSMTLLYLLTPIARKHRAEVIAITINEGIHGYRDQTIEDSRKLCADLGVELHVVSFQDELDITTDKIASLKTNKKVCSYCGVFRRNLLNKKARELNCNVLATGHNLDDEAQVALMNFMRSEYTRIARMSNSLDEVRRIKPLRDAPEREVAVYAMLKGLMTDFNECPNVNGALRREIGLVLNGLEDKYPGTKYSILRSNEKLAEILKEQAPKRSVNHCKLCSELSAGNVCKTCQFKIELSELGSNL